MNSPHLKLIAWEISLYNECAYFLNMVMVRFQVHKVFAVPSYRMQKKFMRCTKHDYSGTLPCVNYNPLFRVK